MFKKFILIGSTLVPPQHFEKQLRNGKDEILVSEIREDCISKIPISQIFPFCSRKDLSILSQTSNYWRLNIPPEMIKQPKKHPFLGPMVHLGITFSQNFDPVTGQRKGGDAGLSTEQCQLTQVVNYLMERLSLLKPRNQNQDYLRRWHHFTHIFLGRFFVFDIVPIRHYH